MSRNVRIELQQIARRLSSGGWRNDDVVCTVVTQLREIADYSVDNNPNATAFAVGYLSLLVELRTRNQIDSKNAELFLDSLSRDTTGAFLISDDANTRFLLQGPNVNYQTKTPTHTCALYALNPFCEYYAKDLGITTYPGDGGKDYLWKRLTNGTLNPGALSLDSPNHVIWFTDASVLRLKCPHSGSSFDASSAYHALGLNWQLQHWDTLDTTCDSGSTRAILLTCALSSRAKADRGIRIPTAIDGWGHMFFLPLTKEIPSCTWKGGCALNPITGETDLPEGVHWKLQIPRGDYTVSPAGHVRVTERLDRIRSHYSEIIDRFSALLTQRIE